jgi:hypothetical protein
LSTTRPITAGLDWADPAASTSGRLSQLRGQAGAGGDAELAERVTQVGFDGGLGYEQVLGDLPVGQAARRELGDLALRAGQRVRAGDGGAAGPGADRQEFPPGLLGQSGLYTVDWRYAFAFGAFPGVRNREMGLEVDGRVESGTPVGTVSGTTTTFTDTGVRSGTTYFYDVAARNRVGVSPDSNEVSLTARGAGAAPPAGFAGAALPCGTLSYGRRRG